MLLALRNDGLIILGYKHLQRALPILFQHLLPSYVEQVDNFSFFPLYFLFFFQKVCKRTLEPRNCKILMFVATTGCWEVSQLQGEVKFLSFGCLCFGWDWPSYWPSYDIPRVSLHSSSQKQVHTFLYNCTSFECSQFPMKTTMMILFQGHYGMVYQNLGVFGWINGIARLAANPRSGTVANQQINGIAE